MEHKKDMEPFTPSKDPETISNAPYSPTKGMFGRNLRDIVPEYQSPVCVEKYVPTPITDSNDGSTSEESSSMPNQDRAYSPTKLMDGTPIDIAFPTEFEDNDFMEYVPSPIKALLELAVKTNKINLSDDTPDDKSMSSIQELLNSLVDQVSDQQENIIVSRDLSKKSSNGILKSPGTALPKKAQHGVRFAEKVLVLQEDEALDELAVSQKNPACGILLPPGIKRVANTSRSVSFAETLEIIYEIEPFDPADRYYVPPTDLGIELSDLESDSDDDDSENSKIVETKVAQKKVVKKADTPVLEVIKEDYRFELDTLVVKGACLAAENPSGVKKFQLIDDDMDLFTDKDLNELAAKDYKKNCPALIPLKCSGQQPVDPRIDRLTGEVTSSVGSTSPMILDDDSNHSRKGASPFTLSDLSSLKIKTLLRFGGSIETGFPTLSTRSIQSQQTALKAKEFLRFGGSRVSQTHTKTTSTPGSLRAYVNELFKNDGLICANSENSNPLPMDVEGRNSLKRQMQEKIDETPKRVRNALATINEE